MLGAFLISLSMYTLFHSYRAQNTSKISFAVYFFYAGLAAVFFSSLLFIAGGVMKERVQAQKMNSKLEKEKTEQELKFLKSQINPHFLFNAINSIYVLIKKDPDLAAATLARFSDMLRYQLYECNFVEVPIEKEIEYLDNYIELEKLRKGVGLAIDYHVDLGASNFLISPLLIIPFVENAFKHVSNFSDKGNYIDIRLTYLEGLFRLTVRNSVDFEGLRQTETQIGGIGQDNTRRRLKLIYPEKHHLFMEDDKENYFVSLSIYL
jgi:two-component system, LytTR family, sensor kinase